MTSDTICGSSVVSNQDKSNLTNLQNQMLSVGKQISTETNNLYTTNNDLYNTMSQNSAQFNKNVDMYKKNDSNQYRQTHRVSFLLRPFHFIQLSISSFLTRPKSFTLFVTTTAPIALAWAAIMRSAAPS